MWIEINHIDKWEIVNDRGIIRINQKVIGVDRPIIGSNRGNEHEVWSDRSI